MKTLHFLLAAMMSVMSSATVLAQEATMYERGATYQESTLPPSPEPSSAVKFADIPFTHSLGLAEYSIPIYSIEGRELSLPIGLHYASGGIKVDEIAGIAGLGWNLQAGGCITRTVIDLPDEYSAPAFRHQTPSGELLERLEAGNRDTINTATLNYLIDLLRHKVDSGLDRYSYNVCGLSGTFVIQDNGKVFQLTGDGVKIAYTRDSDGAIDTFTLTGPDGTVYTLSVKETATHNGRSNTSMSVFNNAPDKWSATTAWHISEMRSRSGLETISFSYSDPISWDRDVYVSRQTCSFTGPHIAGESPNYGRDFTYISTCYHTRHLTSISFPGTTIDFEYGGGNSRVKHTDTIIPKYNCPVMLSNIIVTHSGNPSQTLRAEFGTATALYDGRVLLNSLKFYRGGILDDKWDFEYNELNHTISHYSQDWHGYYNGQLEYSDSGRKNLCPYELKANKPCNVTQSGIPDPKYSDYMSLSAVDHDGAKMYFDYEANTISFNSKDYHVGVRVKRISAKEGFRAIIPRYFTYEDPYIIGHNDPPQEMYGTIKGTIRATGAVSVCDWEASFSDNPVAIGPSIRDTRIVYGRVTEDRGDKALLFVNYTAPASNTARTVYIYDTSDVRPNNYNTIERFPERWISYYNSYGARGIDPWMGVRKGYTCEEPERKPLLTRKEEYAYEDGEYKLVSSVDYEYETGRGSSVLVDYRATQVMFKQQAGNVDYSDIYHFPIYAHSRMGSNPIKEMRVGYHESGNDTTIVSTKYHTRSSLDVPVRVQQKRMTDKSRTTFVNYKYADHMLSSSWADELNDSHYLSVPITVSKQTLQCHPIKMNSLQLPMVLPVTNIKEEVVEYDWITISGNRILLPSAHIEKTGGVESWRETVLSRDGLGNISSFKEKGQPETVVLWGYKGQLPVAVIRNSSFEEVKALFSSTSVMDSFALSTKPMSEYNRILSTLRTELPSAHVTTYTYVPGVGISTVTDEAGMVTTYEYDHAGRLVCVKDNDGKKVNEYTYSLMSDSDGRKHIRSKTYRSDDGTKYTEDVSWWDVFGRKTEDIAIAASTSGKDLVTAYGSDFLLHDDVKTWLPYPVANSGGAFQTDAEQAAAQYHGNDKAYTFNKYELSNRDRVVSTAVAGYAGVHETSFLQDIAIDLPILEWKEDGIVERGVYDSCDIVIDKVVDADGRISLTFRNQLGQTLATSKASDTPTYYIYDELEQLRAVVNSGISLTDTLSMWRYDYDSLGRLKSKGIPNSAREFYTYDQEDRLVSVLRNGALKEMEYDAMGRVVKVYHSSNEATRALWEEHTYDTYPQGVSGADPKGLVTKSKIAKIAPDGAVSGYATTTYVYDAKKRPTLVRTRYSDGSRLTTETQYTFSGEAQSVRSLYEYNAGADELVVEYTYDVRGRLTKETATLCASGSAPQVAEVSYGYDALGRLAHKLSSVPDGKMLHETIEFTLQGWQTGLSVSLDGRLLFSQTLGYDAQESMSSYQPQYSGLISIKDESWFPMSGPAVNDSKWYTYDYAGRLSTEHSPNSRTTYSYDVRGNLLEVRDYNPYSKSSYTYLKDRLLSMTISSPDNQAMYGFTYDVLGRMLYDGMTGQFVTYNDLDLVGKITKNGITLVNYAYLADGVKLSALDSDGEGLVYRGPFVYRKGSGNSSLTLESAAFSGGRMTPNGAMLYVTDYLGSVRAVVDGTSGELYKVSDFSAFGAESRVESMQNATTQLGMIFRDSYTGKEDQHLDFSTHYTDFGARQYNPVIRRWMTPDPLSEKYYGTSPYAFSNNNPVNFVDLDGRHWVLNQRTGNYEWVDGITTAEDATGDYYYIGPTDYDLLKHLNINLEYETQQATVYYGIGDGDSRIGVLFYAPVGVTCHMSVLTNIKYDYSSITESNKMGIIFNGITFRTTMTQNSSNPLNPYMHEAGASLNITYGEHLFNMILSKPTYPYLKGINETVLAGAINIPANVLASHLTFGKATLYIGVTGSVNYTKGTTINWDIERQTMFRPRKSN